MCIFFLSSFFSLSCVIVGSAMGLVVFRGCGFIQQGEKGGAYGSQDSHQVVSAQRKKELQTRETNGTEQYL